MIVSFSLQLSELGQSFEDLLYLQAQNTHQLILCIYLSFRGQCVREVGATGTYNRLEECTKRAKVFVRIGIASLGALFENSVPLIFAVMPPPVRIVVVVDQYKNPKP